MGRLAELDQSLALDRAPYEARLSAVLTRLQAIQQAMLHQGARGLIVFEGWDAAGKGGAIRRMSSALDPRGFRVWPIAAPSAEEKAHHYLWRFWRRLPPAGEIAVFDRSWYGRVMVERVEGFATDVEWRRAYDEINMFEAHLLDDGVRIAKIFLAIDPDEQLARFEKRLADPLKRWKLSFEDLRNRDRWADYEAAVEEMLARTSPERAPWQLIAANSKRYARVTALEHVADRLSDGLDLTIPEADPDLVRRFEAERNRHGSDDVQD